MSNNLLYQRWINIFCCHHRNTSMTSIMRLMRASYQFHNWHPIGIIVVAICKVLSLRRMKQVFTSFVIPLFENRIGSVMYWNRSNATVRLAFYNFKVMFIYENILYASSQEVQKLLLHYKSTSAQSERKYYLSASKEH